jgi:hypothetical protein
LSGVVNAADTPDDIGDAGKRTTTGFMTGDCRDRSFIIVMVIGRLVKRQG